MRSTGLKWFGEMKMIELDDRQTPRATSQTVRLAARPPHALTKRTSRHSRNSREIGQLERFGRPLRGVRFEAAARTAVSG